MQQVPRTYSASAVALSHLQQGIWDVQGECACRVTCFGLLARSRFALAIHPRFPTWLGPIAKEYVLCLYLTFPASLFSCFAVLLCLCLACLVSPAGWVQCGDEALQENKHKSAAGGDCNIGPGPSKHCVSVLQLIHGNGSDNFTHTMPRMFS